MLNVSNSSPPLLLETLEPGFHHYLSYITALVKAWSDLPHCQSTCHFSSPSSSICLQYLTKLVTIFSETLSSLGFQDMTPHEFPFISGWAYSLLLQITYLLHLIVLKGSMP